MLHLDEHDYLVRILHLSDCPNGELAWKLFSLQDVLHVSKLEFEVKVFDFNIFRHVNFEALVCMIQKFQSGALMFEDLGKLFVLE